MDARIAGWVRGQQASTAAGAIGGVGTVDGFIANTANYSALSEPWVTIGSSVNGTSIRQSPWVLDVSAS